MGELFRRAIQFHPNFTEIRRRTCMARDMYETMDEEEPQIPIIYDIRAMSWPWHSPPRPSSVVGGPTLLLHFFIPPLRHSLFPRGTPSTEHASSSNLVLVSFEHDSRPANMRRRPRLPPQDTIPSSPPPRPKEPGRGGRRPPNASSFVPETFIHAFAFDRISTASQFYSS